MRRLAGVAAVACLALSALAWSERACALRETAQARSEASAAREAL